MYGKSGTATIRINRNKDSSFLSIKDWTDEELKIKEPIIDALLDEGFVHPSIIQSVAIPLIIRNEDNFYGYKNLVAQSPNGSGKSLAFIVGCLQRIDPSNPKCQVLLLMPNRELINQCFETLQTVNRYTKYTISMI